LTKVRKFSITDETNIQINDKTEDKKDAKKTEDKKDVKKTEDKKATSVAQTKSSTKTKEEESKDTKAASDCAIGEGGKTTSHV